MPRKSKKSRRNPKITPYRGKEKQKIVPFQGTAGQSEGKKKKEKKVQRIIPFRGKAKIGEEKGGKPSPFEGKRKKEDEKDQRQRKKVQRIIPFEEKAKEKKETLATLFGERLLGSMPGDEVGIAPAETPQPRLSAPTGRPRDHSPLPRVSATLRSPTQPQLPGPTLFSTGCPTGSSAYGLPW